MEKENKKKLENESIDILNLHASISNPLKRNGIFMIKDLTSISYKDLSLLKQIGNVRAKVIRNKLNELGLSFINEENDPFLIKEKLKNNNIVILEDLDFNYNICLLLYQNKIFTLDDLLKNISNLKKLHNIGNLSERQILEQIRILEYESYKKLEENKEQIKNISMLIKVIGIELELDLDISKKKIILKQLKEIVLKLNDILLDDNIENIVRTKKTGEENK